MRFSTAKVKFSYKTSGGNTIFVDGQRYTYESAKAIYDITVHDDNTVCYHKNGKIEISLDSFLPEDHKFFTRIQKFYNL